MKSTPLPTLPQTGQGSTCTHSIDNCSVDTDPPSSNPLPVHVRIFFSPEQSQGLLRMRVALESFLDSFFLDISPDNAESLRFVAGPPAYIDFRTKHITLIAPTGFTNVAVTASEQDMITRMLATAKLTAARIFLPDGKHITSSLMSFCEAVNQGNLLPDLAHTDLKSLYRGKGGRILKDSDLLWPPSYGSTTSPPPVGLLPGPTLTPTTRDDNLPPYSHPQLGSLPPPPLLSSPVVANNKRARSCTPLHPTRTPRYHSWKQLDLACEAQQTLMSGILWHLDNKETSVLALMKEVERKEAELKEYNNKLTSMLAAAKKTELVRLAVDGIPQAEGLGTPRGRAASEVSTASFHSFRSEVSTVSASLARPSVDSIPQAEEHDMPQGREASEVSTASFPSSRSEVSIVSTSLGPPSVDSIPQAERQDTRQGRAASEVSTASFPSSVSDISTITAFPNVSGPTQAYVIQQIQRLQAYVNQQIQRLRDDIAIEYATVDSVQNQIQEEVNDMLSDHVEKEEMDTAISNTVDDKFEEFEQFVTDRIQEALDEALCNHVETEEMHEAIDEAIASECDRIRSRMRRVFQD